MDSYDAQTGEVLAADPSAQRLPDTRLQHPALLTSPDTSEVWSALVQAQAKIEPPARTKTAKVAGKTRDGANYSYEYKYAPLDEVIAKVRQPLLKAGLGFQQFLAMRGGQHAIRTVVFHKSGQWTAVDYPIFYDTTKGAQGFASGVTYARRYGLTLALGLAPEDDDDANVADSRPAAANVADSRPAAANVADSRPAAVRSSGRAAPVVAQPEPDADSARAAVQRIRGEIANAIHVEQLNETGINGPNRIEDEALIKAQASGAAVWGDLVNRDAYRRLMLGESPT